MDATEIRSLVEKIHASDTRIVLAVTGGGSGAISALFTVPGASRSMLLATVPYSDTAMTEWLGSRPEQFCSSQTARAMAMVAYDKARQLDPAAAQLAGIGCTASLASDRPKRGPHRFFVATQTADATTSLYLELEKDRRSRGDEEQITAIAILNEIAAACGVSARLPLKLAASEQPISHLKEAPADWQPLLAGKWNRLLVGASAESPRVLFPGAFNPLHVGHLRMAETASDILAAPVAFEISIANVDKPPLDFIELETRLQQFSAGQSVWLTRAPTFVEKVGLFPGVTFVVGVDTLERIVEPRYYHQNVPAMLRAIEQIAAAGCRFLVFGRQYEGRFQSLDDLSLPPSLLAICQAVPEQTFREDISSTELRQSQSVP